ncbi:MAG: hypothetical protein ACXV7F_04805 [Methylomonas sp.]
MKIQTWRHIRLSALKMALYFPKTTERSSMDMKVKHLIFALLITMASSAHSTETPPPGTYLSDIVIYRPFGFITTVAGTALFVAISPLTALANISPPHDAFEIAAESLIITPAKFTFDRPLGVIFPDEDGEYRRH